MKNNTVISLFVLMLTYLSIGASTYLRSIGTHTSSKSISEIIIVGVICFIITIVAGYETITKKHQIMSILYIIVLIVALLIFSLFCLL